MYLAVSRRKLGCFFATLAPFILLAGTPLHAQDQDARHMREKRIVGDYCYDTKYNTPSYSADQIPYHRLTHIIHCGIGFDDAGNLLIPDGFIEPELITRAHDARVKVMLLFSGDVSSLETNPAVVATLVKNLKTFVTEHDYDGLDLDWEYPSSPADTAELLTLMTAVRHEFPSPRYLLSIDAAPFIEPNYDVPHLRKVIDWFNVMTYDCAGPWTAYFHFNSPIFWDPKDTQTDECEPGASDKESADIFLADAPASQITQGTPFYGYDYTNVKTLFGLCPNAATTEDGACDDTVLTLNYGTDIKPLIDKKGWERHRDMVSLVPYLSRRDGSPGFITYDDPLSTYVRVWYSDWDRGLGGTFLWALDEDYDGHSQDLLDAMYKASKRIPPWANLPSR